MNDGARSGCRRLTLMSKCPRVEDRVLATVSETIGAGRDLVEPEEFVDTYPRIFHTGHPNAWEGIRRYGLLSTSALLDLFGVSGERREAIEARRRPEPVLLEHPVHGTAWIRDNTPVHDSRLGDLLVDMTREDYYRLLNRHVFFWPTRKRLDSLLGARAYRSDPQLVIEIDTEALVERHGGRIKLSSSQPGKHAP